ncbi:MAG: hypothetical protein JO017_03200 [Actinobacteria bacterium]|nr:hypothetical protein [Actinomycetota bacterium]
MVRDLHEGRYDLAEMGRRGREWVVREADRGRSVGAYKALLSQLVRAS